MYKVEQPREDARIVETASECNCLYETCIYTEYHPDYGRVEPYWKPKWFIKIMLQRITEST